MPTLKESVMRVVPLLFLPLLFSQTLANNKTIRPKIDLCAYIPPLEKRLHRDDVVDIALKQRKDLEAFIYAERASQYDERAALAGYLPQIQLSAQIGKADPDQFLLVPTCRESISSKALSITVSQLILNGGGPIIDYKIAQEATKIVQENLKLSQDNVRLSVETAFLNMQRFLLEKTFIESRDIASKALFEQSSAKNMVGFLNESSWLASTASYVNDQTTIANYARDLQTALWTLQRQIGTDITIDEINLTINDSTKIDLQPLDYYLGKALHNRPNLKIQDHLIRQAQLAEKKYRNSYIPSISIYAQASDIGPRETFFESREITNNLNNALTASWSAGLQISWSFDGLANVHAARKSDNQEIEYVLQRKDLELQVKQDVESAYNQVKNNKDLLKTAVVQFEQADATLKLKKKQCDVGAISQVDLAQTEQAYESSRFQLDSSKIDMRVAYQNLLFACGYPKIDTHCI